MTKESIVKSCIRYIRYQAKVRKLTFEDNGEGHAFEGSFWQGILADRSGIPEVAAKDEAKTYSINLRSFWGSPEIDIRMKKDDGNVRLICINWSDYDKGAHTGNFRINEIRADGHGDTEKLLRYALRVVRLIEKHAKREEADGNGSD